MVSIGLYRFYIKVKTSFVHNFINIPQLLLFYNFFLGFILMITFCTVLVTTC